MLINNYYFISNSCIQSECRIIIPILLKLKGKDDKYENIFK